MCQHHWLRFRRPPYKADIAPCTCGYSTGTTHTLTLVCANQNKTDADLVNHVSLFPILAPEDTMDLSGNALSRVPNRLASYFPQLAHLNMANNSITAIQTGDLNGGNSISQLLDFSNNKISIIQANALPSEYINSTANDLYYA